MYISAVKKLARNDANKKLLVEVGALELLVKLAEGNVEEQLGRSLSVYSSWLCKVASSEWWREFFWVCARKTYDKNYE